MPLRQTPTTAVQAPLVLLTGTLPKERLCTALRRPIGDYCHFPRPRHWKLPPQCSTTESEVRRSTVLERALTPCERQPIQTMSPPALGRRRCH